MATLSLRAFKTPPQTKLNTECITCTRPEHDGETIAFTKYWKVILHPDQSGLGSCLMAPLRHVPRICDQTPEESADFFEVVRELEPALERSFGATLINFSCLRNWAYRTHDPDPPFRNGQPNPHVHWHVLTRYAQPVTFESVTFTDEAFGEPFEPNGERAQGIRDKIIAKIQGELRLEYS